GRVTVSLREEEHPVLLPSYRGVVGATNTASRFDERLQHRLEIEGRATDDLEDIGGRGLPLQRFPKLVGQAAVLNRDNGLSGEVLDQLDLLVGERADFLAIDDNAADQLILLEHWHLNERARPRELDQRRTCVWLFRRAIGNLSDLPCLDEAAHIDRHYWVPPSQFFELQRNAMHGNRSKFMLFE